MHWRLNWHNLLNIGKSIFFLMRTPCVRTTLSTKPGLVLITKISYLTIENSRTWDFLQAWSLQFVTPPEACHSNTPARQSKELRGRGRAWAPAKRVCFYSYKLQKSDPGSDVSNTGRPFPASLEAAPHTIREPASQRLKGRVREPGRAKQKGREIFITMTASFLVRIYEPIGEEGSTQSMN